MWPFLGLGRPIEAAAYGRRQSGDAGFKTVSQPGFKYLSGHLEFLPRFIGVRSVVSLTVRHTWKGRAVGWERDKLQCSQCNFDGCHVQFRDSSNGDIRPEHIIPTQNPLMTLLEAAGSALRVLTRS